MTSSRLPPTVCLDVGSTWTKALLVDPDGDPAAFAQQPTISTDVVSGMDAVVEAVRGTLPSAPADPEPQVLACSSAGGGLRLAVVGVDRLASEEAGHRVARSAGARVVHIHAGALQPVDVRAMRARRPGAVLLVGGFDGAGGASGAGSDAGKSDAGKGAQLLLHNAGQLARARVRYPVVLAGSTAARADALALLRSTGRTVLVCDNVLPRQGVFAPESARAAVAELFERQVVGGRGAPAGARFRRLVRTATPGAVCLATAELAKIGVDGAVVVVDIGSTTTGVYSAATDGLCRRTVEGDLGMRCAAAGVLLAGQLAELLDPVEADLLAPSVQRMTEDTGYLPAEVGGAAEDRRIAAVAAVVALRRHLATQESPARIGLVVLTGGVCRQRDAGGMAALESTLRTDPELAPALAGAAVRMDTHFLLAPAGLLAGAGASTAAQTLLRDHLLAA